MRKHGMVGTRLYNTWRGMKQRCLNPNNKEYPNYGGRGISICDEWLDFEMFETWAFANGYRNDLTIDRRNVDKGYSPKNCKWSSLTEQNNNKRNNIVVMDCGKPITLANLSRKTGINYCTLQMRYYRGKFTRAEAEAALREGE